MRAPVSGSTSARCPTAGSSPSRGSTISTASTEWRTRSDPSGRSQPCCSRKSEMTTTRPGWRASRPHPRQRVAPARRVVLAVRRHALGERPAQRDDPGLAIRGAAARAAARRRTRPARRCPRGAPPRRPNTSATPSATSALSRLRGAEGHRRARRRARSRSSGSARERAGARAAGRRCARWPPGRCGARRRRPRTGAAGPARCPAPMPAARRSPGQRPGHQPVDPDVERVDQRLGHGSRPLSRGGRLQQRRAHAPRAAPVEPSGTIPVVNSRGRVRLPAPGSGTAASTRSSTSSAVTPSLRAS